MAWNRVVIWCDCGAHALSVEREVWRNPDGSKEPPETNLQFWKMDGVSRAGRIRTAWAALRGKLYHDGVCLKEDEVSRLIDALRALPKEGK